MWHNGYVHKIGLRQCRDLGCHCTGKLIIVYQENDQGAIIKMVCKIIAFSRTNCCALLFLSLLQNIVMKYQRKVFKSIM